MSLLIGKQLPDGAISYIQVDYFPKLPYMVNMLRNFYPTEKQVDQLLELGDLEEIGATPRGQWQGNDDPIHCCAKIRDRKERSRRLSARIAEDMEELLKQGYALHYIFDQGEWYIITKHKKENIRTVSEAIFDTAKTKKDLKSLTIKENKRSNNYSNEKLEFSSWEEMKQKAEENNTTYFVYFGDKLLTTVNPIALHLTRE